MTTRQQDIGAVGFSQVGGLQNEEVNRSGSFAALDQGLRAFGQARDRQKKRDAAERLKADTLEFADQDLATLGDAYDESLNATEESFTSGTDGKGQDVVTVALRNRGGRANAIKAQAREFRAFRDKLSSAPAEDIPRLVQTFQARGLPTTASQFLQSQDAAEQEAFATAGADIEEAIEDATGIKIPVTDQAALGKAWLSGDPSVDTYRQLMAETSERAILQKTTENNIEGAMLGVTTWSGNTMERLQAQFLEIPINQLSPETEAAATSSIADARAQLELRIANMPEENKEAMRANFETRADQIMEIANGNADRRALTTASKQKSLLKADADLALSKAQKKLTEAQTLNEELEFQTGVVTNIVTQSEAMREIATQLAVSESGKKPSEMTPIELAAYNDPDLVANFTEAAAATIGALVDQIALDAGQVDIGPAGAVTLGGDWQRLPPDRKIAGVTAVWASYLGGQNPFEGENSEAALRLISHDAARTLASASGEERQALIDQLRPLADRPEFGQLAKDAGEAFQPVLNLLLDDARQQASSSIGALATNLDRSDEYSRALSALPESTVLTSEQAVTRARARSGYTINIIQSRADELAERVLTLEDSPSTAPLDALLESLDTNPSSYLEDVGRDGWAETKASLESLVTPETASLVRDLGIQGDRYFKAREMLLQQKVRRGRDTYQTMLSATEVDEEELNATGTYQLRLNDDFRAAFSSQPEFVTQIERQVSMHNSSPSMKRFRQSINTVANANGFEDPRQAYELFRAGSGAMATGSLLPPTTLLEDS